ncbi:FeoA family protein [Tardiphaga sp. 1201_B9_N1_1]|jgi:ferrous iron transport protein A|uniref:Ferrous iron transport protein A n=1 Tax=Tardiphaga robiniae TaxID=943830 RepID=A0A7G6U5X6_9BRAD|nr:MULTISPECIES: FeoA family protein [Tardiphaga]NUU40201.1 ferrous iron transport protein A [Tardiphaga robiniae]QND74408.1 ferrous iron transport protein A [Tardiphaga robiniae]UFS74765.1 ferrous iron transport protein A [Tardiphaga sp. 37S4]SNT58120.1 ferrous iron transport protein A [Tardiphaga sp. OK246]
MTVHQTASETSIHELRLGNAPRGFIGTIVALQPDIAGAAESGHELERHLLEMGFTEGARVEILHQGAIQRDPIAVRVDNITIAVRRREAMAVVVK